MVEVEVPDVVQAQLSLLLHREHLVVEDISQQRQPD
jgi:hypothetical protein